MADFGSYMGGGAPQQATEPEDRFAPVPRGWHSCRVADCEVRSNDRGWTGVSFKLEIVEGNSRGRLIFDQVTIAHSNSKAVEIGRQGLAERAWAMGFGNVPTDTTQYVDQHLDVLITHKPDPYRGPDAVRENVSNVAKFRAKAGQPSGQTAPNMGAGDIPF